MLKVAEMQGGFWQSSCMLAPVEVGKVGGPELRQPLSGFCRPRITLARPHGPAVGQLSGRPPLSLSQAALGGEGRVRDLGELDVEMS